jgi:hypothetical protein
MIKQARKQSLKLSAAVMTGAMLSPSLAFAQTATFSSVSTNLTDSLKTLPGLISGLSYLFGILLGVLGVLKIKDHVENPGNAPLKDGAIRLAAGGALLALPFILKVAVGSVMGTGTTTGLGQATLGTVGSGT